MVELPDRLSRLPAQDLERLVERLRVKRGAGPDSIPRRASDAPAVLSFSQQQLWFLTQMESDSAAYNIPLALRIKGSLNVDALRASLQEIVQRHEVLRTLIINNAGSPAANIVQSPAGVLSQLDLSSGPNPQELMLRLARDEFQRPFDLSTELPIRALLLRLAADEHALIFNLHHIAADFWSFKLLWRELTALYKDAAAGSAPSLPPLAVQYADYAAWQRERVRGERLQAGLSYWRRALAGAPLLSLPADRKRPPRQSFRGSSQALALPQKLTADLKALARAHETSLFVTLLAGLMTLLYRSTGQRDIVIGSTVTNRSRAEQEPLIGFFANIVPLRGDLSGAPTFQQLLGRLRQTVLNGFNHHEIPFEKLVEELQPTRSTAYHPLVQVAIALYDSPWQPAPLLPELEITPIDVNLRISRLDIEFLFWEPEQSTGLEGVWNYNADLFDEATIGRLIAQWKVLLQAAVANPETPVDVLPLSADPEHLVTIESAAAVDDPGLALLPEHSMDVGLKQWSGALAEHLHALGIGPGTPVALLLPAGPARTAGILATLAAGGTLVALDPAPSRWLAQSLRQSGCRFVLASAASHAQSPADAAGLTWIDPEPFSGKAPAATSAWSAGRAASSVACLYHEGPGQLRSLPDPALAARLAQLQAQLALTPEDRVWQHTPLHQEAGLWETLWPLSVGAALVAGETAPDEALWQLLVRLRVTVAHLTARELNQLVASTPLRQLRGDPQGSDALRLVLCAGEPPAPETAAAFAARFSAQLVCLYAPPMSSAIFAVPSSLRSPQMVAAQDGWPLSKDLLVVDRIGQRIPAGTLGEICIAAGPGQLVRTGDLGILQADGCVYLMGSCDGREWVDAQRIDLAQINAAILEDSAIVDCAVLVRSCAGVGRQLVAFVVASEAAAIQSLPADLLARLAEHLPRPLLPDAIVPVFRLPRAADGTPDRLALEQLPVIDAGLAARYESALRAAPQVSDAAVLTQAAEVPLEAVHLDDLLPERGAKLRQTRRAASAVQAAQDSIAVRAGTQALVTGPALRIPEGAPLTLAEGLRIAAQAPPDRGILCITEDDTASFLSYTELGRAAERVAAGLRSIGLTAGQKVLLQLHPNEDFFFAFWGCVLAGLIPVSLSVPNSYREQNSGVIRLMAVWQKLEQPLILAGDMLAPAIRDLESETDFVGLRVASLGSMLAAEPEPDAEPVSRRPEDPALILMTSGSTGKPKGVTLTHRNVCLRTLSDIQAHGLSDDDVTLNWMPLDHVVGLVMYHVRDLLVGSRQIHASTTAVLADPLRWLEWCERFKVTITWAPNFAYGLVNDKAAELGRRRFRLQALRRIENGAETIVSSTARRFLELLEPHGLRPNAMFTGWGMSETTAGVTFNYNFSRATTRDEDKFVDLGVPMPGVAFRVVDDTDQVVEEGRIGHLQLSGVTVCSGYINDPELTQKVFTADGWFRTGDLAYVSGGHLTLTGRESEVIIINGVNYHFHEIESAAESVDGVETSFTAACALRPAGSQTDRLLIFFHPDETHGGQRLPLLNAIRTAVLRRVGITPDYLIPVERKDIPKTGVGKIQRSLLLQRFEDGDFAESLKRVDLAMRNSNTLPSWFFSPVWQRSEASASANRGAAMPGDDLLFVHGGALAQALVTQRTAHGRRSIVVEPGGGLTALSADRYQLDPNKPDQYRQLMELLAGEGVRPDRIVHLWNYGAGRADTPDRHYELGVQSVAFLTAALAAQSQRPAALRLLIVTSFAAQVRASDPLVCERAPLLGLPQTISQELPGMLCTQLDLPPGLAERDAQQIAAELERRQSEEVVAYRDRERFVRGLDMVDLRRERRAGTTLVQGGWYVLIGGLGGVGTALARHLIETYQARLLIIGRTPLEAAGHEHLGGAAVERRAAFESLRALDKDVSYEALDICDSELLIETVARAQAGRRLDGIFHLAASASLRALSEETAETLTAALRPKTLGTISVFRLAERHPTARVVCFSSVLGFMGGAMVGAYAAANAFQDAYCAEQRERLPQPVHCLSFSGWEGLGASRQVAARDAARARGFLNMNPAQALMSMEAALHGRVGHLLIGLDSSQPAIVRRLAHEGPLLAHELVGFYARPAGMAPDASIHVAPLRDRFGTELHCATAQVPELPRTADGRVDLQRLALLRAGSQGRAHAAPRNDLERHLAGLFRDVLGVSEVGIYDSFFDLGGHSLQAAQLTSRLRETFSIDFPLQRLFSTVTVAAVAEAMADYEQVPGQVAKVASILERVKQMSVEDAEALYAQLSEQGQP